VGHETDTTLIDYVSDRRAPTPTAAAEMAVPVREDLLYALQETGGRLTQSVGRMLQNRSDAVTGLTRGLLHPGRLIEVATQRLDDWSERLFASLPAAIAQKNQLLSILVAKLQPRNLLVNITRHMQDLKSAEERMLRMLQRNILEDEKKLQNIFQLLESLSPNRVLERGFALVWNAEGKVVTRADALKSEEMLELVFFDGIRKATTTKI
jgi:exodeoxyribonuclease VII large subunit